MLNEDFIIECNKLAGETGVLNRKDLLHSALSSWYYYSSIELQISSIIRGLCKNHAFVDGNKRTSILCLISLCDEFNLKFPNDNELFAIIIDIASHNYSVETITNLIFKQ